MTSRIFIKLLDRNTICSLKITEVAKYFISFFLFSTCRADLERWYGISEFSTHTKVDLIRMSTCVSIDGNFWMTSPILPSIYKIIDGFWYSLVMKVNKYIWKQKIKGLKVLCCIRLEHTRIWICNILLVFMSSFI